MDGSLKDENTVEAGVSPADEIGAAGTAAATEEKKASPAPTELSLNELEKLDALFPIARDFNLHLHPIERRIHSDCFDIQS
ncbi:MAG: hypothetical protein DMF29_09290 [Verrucomicrobia bacterium]|nr:MAG: hypothetical protein DMF29_09290 [Verrucomicrobiota bacterium]